MVIISELADLIAACFIVFGLSLTTMLAAWLLMRLLNVVIAILDIDI